MKGGLIIAIAGCPCAGKTTLSRWIKGNYDNVTIIHMDDYYRDINDPEMPYLTECDSKCPDWESLASFDITRFHDDFHSHVTNMASTQDSILVLEGIFAYSLTEIQSHLQLKYFLDISYETALSRRRVQPFQTAEPDDYFDRVAWPVHLKSLQHASNQSDIKILGEDMGSEEIKEKVSRDVNAWKGVKEVQKEDGS